MIINKNTNPQKDLYYIGALLIDILNDSRQQKIEFFKIFQILNEKEKISINLFVLAIDWLFLMKIVDFKKGEVIKCF